MTYTCSVCQLQVEGDLVVFQEHTDKHIIDLVKHDHPEWVKDNGVCQKCYDYYQSEIDGSVFKDAPCAIRIRKVNKVKDFFKNLLPLGK